MEGEEIIELESSIDELVDATLGINHAQGFDLNVDLHSIYVDDVAPPTVKFGDAKHHASLLYNFLLDNSLHFGVNKIFSFEKLVGNLDKMTIANLGRQHQRSLNSYFKSSWVPPSVSREGAARREGPEPHSDCRSGARRRRCRLY
jgi:hypothetical protein